MKKCTVKSPANIAFVKYWGKTDPKTRVPATNSISMCLLELFSTCTIEFQEKLQQDEVEFVGEKVVTGRELSRIIKVLDRVRDLAKTDCKARVVTQNNFPKATGIASSASGLSSVTMAAVGSLEIDLTQEELSKLARLASGTASRSIPDGFVEWQKGTSPDNSYGVSIFPPDHWQICDVVAVVTKKMKKISSSDGHKLADTSPFYEARIKGMSEKIEAIKRAIKQKDLTTFGEIVEREALNMHAICLTSKPPILYWEAATMDLMRQVTEWRQAEGLECYFTIDAGPTVHIICQAKDAKQVAAKASQVTGVDEVSINHPSIGARYSDKHLF